MGYIICRKSQKGCVFLYAMSKRFRIQIPVYLKVLLVRIAFALSILSLTRFVFYVYNIESFTNVSSFDWLTGVWFDLVTLFLLLLPFILISSFPENWQSNLLARLVKKATFIFPLLGIVALNILDTEYYNFTQKRSTADLFAIVSAGNDVAQLLTSFIADFWMLILIFGAFVYFVFWVYQRTEKLFSSKNSKSISTKRQLFLFVLILPITILIGRGGTSLKPISPIDATLFTEPQNTALVLNSAFTFLKSYGKADLIEKKYFSEKQLQALINPFKKTHPVHILPAKMNVMIIMLESFGNEWVGAFNSRETYTPFFDSLIKQSWTFEYGISNGKKSIEAVPTILASMPTWMDNPYISSAYGGNDVESLPILLKKEGYSSAFYHGATNGSMRFNSFAKKMGFDQYVGRTEYNNDAHFDKTWGILDEYFNPWTAQQISKLKAPFCATLFTLSSHHPYFVPKKWRKTLKSGPHPICRSIQYGDMSLKLFFEQAKKETWYKNTLFVLVADHTPSTASKLYSLRTQMYKIPIVFFDPQGRLPKRKEKVIFQQLDIMPTVLDLLNVSTDYYAFGNSFFTSSNREALAYLEGTYYYFSGNKLLYFSNDRPTHLLNFTSNNIQPANEFKRYSREVARMSLRTKALIQRYNSDLIHNKTRVP